MRRFGVTFFALLGCAEPREETDSALPCGEFVTWATFGEGFTLNYCQVCHASTAPDRFGAPETITFDTEAEALALSDRILARATGVDADMPPGGGVPADHLILLECWLAQ
jgi:hypothetical protein